LNTGGWAERDPDQPTCTARQAEEQGGRASARNGETAAIGRGRLGAARAFGLPLGALALAGAVGVGLIGCAGIHPSAAPGEALSAPAAGHSGHEAKLTPAKATALLVEGNARFVSGRGQHPRRNPERRRELATGQSPFAVIIGCADSRTSPEVLSEQGLGDLFVIRVAGNVLDDHVLGSLEYAVEHLHSGLVVALGHQRCGAVAAARETVAARWHDEH